MSKLRKNTFTGQYFIEGEDGVVEHYLESYDWKEAVKEVIYDPHIRTIRRMGSTATGSVSRDSVVSQAREILHAIQEHRQIP